MIKSCNYPVLSCLTSKLKHSLMERWLFLEFISLLVAWLFGFEMSEVGSWSTQISYQLHFISFLTGPWSFPEGVLLLQQILGNVVCLILHTFHFSHSNTYLFLQIQPAQIWRLSQLPLLCLFLLCTISCKFPPILRAKNTSGCCLEAIWEHKERDNPSFICIAKQCMKSLPHKQGCSCIRHP